MDKPLSKLLIFLMLAGAVTAAALVLRFHGQSKQPTDLPALLAAVQSPPPSPSSDVVITSPDGNASVTMKEQNYSDGRKTYTFLVSDSNGQRTVLTKTVDSGETFSIPANTFSPDNKYLFLKDVTGSQTNYLILTASGEAITATSPTFEIASLLSAKEPNYKITDVTGWAAPTLIIVNTVRNSDNAPQSFWFEIPTQSFTSLATYFH